ncbi:Calx-beta domain-containing protein, partial [Microcoleus sp. BROC3]|uniref:Calx-beta domain-containing protein n=1 Tax=Microcoleus sp. BROC3 TaxID=3055323 RepID=UPI002FCEE662
NGLTDVGDYASPTLADIDNDGDLDAFVGADDGNTYYYQNTGTASAPTFAAPVANFNGLTNVGSLAAPTLDDIDNDGDLDAFVGVGYGKTYYYQNTGTASAPTFAAPVANFNGLTDVGFFAAPTLADIDNDGDLDAFVGDSDGNIRYFENATRVSIASGTAPTESGTTGTFILTLDTPAPDGFSVNYTIGGTATAGIDYTSLSGTVAFAPGTTTATINVTATNDPVIDPGETVIITLTDAASYDIAVTPQNTATVTIDDNDIEYGIVANNATVAEANSGTTPITYTITRSGRTDVSSTVDYTLAGTATNGTDYNNVVVSGTNVTAAGSKITFAAGATTATINLDVLGDTVAETNETIDVTLSNPTAAAGYSATIPVVTPVTTTITDNDIQYAIV